MNGDPTTPKTAPKTPVKAPRGHDKAANGDRVPPRQERPIPQNIEAERALLGAMMMDRSVIDEVAGMIPSAEFFYVPQHRLLFNALIGVHSRGEPMDLIVVSQHLTASGILDQIGGQDYLMYLAESFADVANAPHYAAILVAYWQRRALISLAGDLAKAGYDPLNDDPPAKCGEFAKALDAIADHRIVGDVHRIDELYEEAVASLGRGGHGYVPCGIPPLDDRTGGLQRPGLIVLAGRPSTGKTTVAVNMLHAIAKQGVAGMLISAEMERLPIALRSLCQLTGDTIGGLRHRSNDPGMTESIADARRRFDESAPVYINDKPKTLRSVVSAIRAAVRRYELGAVAVDYLQLLSCEGKFDNRNSEIAEMTKTFANLSKEVGITLIVLSQLNRSGGANRDGNAPPTEGALRDSGAIEQDADQIIMLYPTNNTEWRMSHTPTLSIDLQKNRNGPRCDCTATFDKASFRLQFGISQALPETPQPKTRPEMQDTQQDEIPF